MKRYRRVLWCIGLLFAICLFQCILILEDTKLENVDTVAMNDVVKAVEENYSDLSQLEQLELGMDYLVLDQEGNVIYQTVENPIDSFYDVLSKNYPHTAIQRNGFSVGEVVLLEGPMQKLSQIRKKMILTLVFTLGSLMLVMYLYGIFVKRTIIRPFQNMHEFANEIAMGNLDVKLARDKDNYFGAFTESFDIMREELSKARTREIALKKREKEMIAQLSHDLKTPVTGIKITSELLKVKVEDAYVRDKISHIYEKAEQIDILVNDLFASTLDELGEIQLVIRDEDSSVLERIVTRYDDQELITQGEIPECVVLMDDRRMDQVVSNCINNSFKYANTRIEVHYRIIEGYLEMQIRDFGPGVAKEELPLLTNKFYRGKAEEVSLQEGSGLGLYIARNLMERMGGEMMLANAVPGFCVRLLIPLA